MATWAAVALLLVFGFVCMLVGMAIGYQARSDQYDEEEELVKADDERLIHAMAMGFGIGHDQAVRDLRGESDKAGSEAGEDAHGDGV